MKIEDATLMVGYYGDFRGHPWLDVDDPGGDAYSLLVSRAGSMGFATSGHQHAAREVWGMNDAGAEPGAQPATWFQVGLADGSYPLPLRAFLSCTADVTTRLGTLELTAVQMLVPLQVSGPSVRDAWSAGGWFAVAEPDRAVEVSLTLDAGADDVLVGVAERIVTEVHRTDRGRELVRGLVAPRPATEPLTVPEFRLGDGRHPITFACELPEWTPDAVGWLIELVAIACRDAGVRTSVLVDVTRSGRQP